MRLSVTTPRGAVVETDVEEITAPGVLGELGVLPGHVPLMAALKPGVLTYRSAHHKGVLAVGEGFLQVAAVADGAGAAQAAAGAAAGEAGHAPAKAASDRILVLVDQATPAASVDLKSAQHDLAEAEKELAGWKRDLDGSYQALRVRRDWALARLEARTRTGGGAAVESH